MKVQRMHGLGRTATFGMADTSQHRFERFLAQHQHTRQGANTRSAHAGLIIFSPETTSGRFQSSASLLVLGQTARGPKHARLRLRIRTPDIQLAKLALYQLSYAPGRWIADFRLPIANCNRMRSAGLWPVRPTCVSHVDSLSQARRLPLLTARGRASRVAHLRSIVLGGPRAGDILPQGVLHQRELEKESCLELCKDAPFGKD